MKTSQPQTPNVTRVNTINILGVTFDDLLNFQNHIDMTISGCMQNLYAIKILKSKGLSGKAIKIVTESYILNKITYALPAWWGFTNATDRQKLQAILNKVHRWGLDGGLQFKPLIEIVNCLEQKMFKSITHNTSHTLYQLLPPTRNSTYNLRPRPHNFEVAKCTTLCDKNFINRLLKRP